MTLSSKFFRDYNKLMMQIFKEKMADLTFKDACFDQGLGDLFTAKLCVDNQELKQFDIDMENSVLHVNSAG